MQTVKSLSKRMTITAFDRYLRDRGVCGFSVGSGNVCSRFSEWGITVNPNVLILRGDNENLLFRMIRAFQVTELNATQMLIDIISYDRTDQHLMRSDRIMAWSG